MIRTGLAALAFAAFLAIHPAAAQDACPVPPTPPAQSELNACGLCIEEAGKKAGKETASGLLTVKTITAIASKFPDWKRMCVEAAKSVRDAGVKAIASESVRQQLKLCTTGKCQSVVNFAESFGRYATLLAEYEVKQAAKAVKK